MKRLTDRLIAVRETGVSRHRGGPIVGPPETPCTSQHYLIEGIKGVPDLGTKEIGNIVYPAWITYSRSERSPRHFEFFRRHKTFPMERYGGKWCKDTHFWMNYLYVSFHRGTFEEIINSFTSLSLCIVYLLYLFKNQKVNIISFLFSKKSILKCDISIQIFQ